ncbi:MAG: hypothetical protein IJH34_08190, partial [Romboutsia sp.]|nr:hypothetical protein [Romboutsia sp.]
MFNVKIGKLLIENLAKENNLINLSDYSITDYLNIGEYLLNDKELFISFINCFEVSFKELNSKNLEQIMKLNKKRIDDLIDKSKENNLDVISIGESCVFHADDNKYYSIKNKIRFNSDIENKLFYSTLTNNFDDLKSIIPVLDEYSLGMDFLPEESYLKIEDAMDKTINELYPNFVLDKKENEWIKSDEDNFDIIKVKDIAERCIFHLDDEKYYCVKNRIMLDNNCKNFKFYFTLINNLCDLQSIMVDLDNYSSCKTDNLSNDCYSKIEKAMCKTIKELYPQFTFDKDINEWIYDSEYKYFNKLDFGEMIWYMIVRDNFAFKNVSRTIEKQMKFQIYLENLVESLDKSSAEYLYMQLSNALDRANFIIDELDKWNEDLSNEYLDLANSSMIAPTLVRINEFVEELFETVFSHLVKFDKEDLIWVLKEEYKLSNSEPKEDLKPSNEVNISFNTKFKMYGNRKDKDNLYFDFACNLPYIDYNDEFKFVNSITCRH